jgi:Lrp/AsnC family transcriptional regulator, leucine-responsive regulatory protein
LDDSTAAEFEYNCELCRLDGARRNKIAPAATVAPKMTKDITFNRTDRRLLDLLQRDGNLTNLELAEKVSLSPSACLRRVRALEKAGVIRRYVALLDAKRVGLGLMAFVNVKLEKKGRAPTDAFARAVKDWPEVMACHSLTGDMDYLLRVQVENLEHFSRFVMDSLLKHPGVVDVRSSFVLEEVKETTALPLTHFAG